MSKKFLLTMEIAEDIIFKATEELSIDDFFENEICDDLLAALEKAKKALEVLEG